MNAEERIRSSARATSESAEASGHESGARGQRGIERRKAVLNMLRTPHQNYLCELRPHALLRRMLSEVFLVPGLQGCCRWQHRESLRGVSRIAR